MTIIQSKKSTKEEEPLDPNDCGPTPQQKLEELIAVIEKEIKESK